MCLSSLSGQSDKKFDILIIDGGSTDDTKHVISSFKRKLNVTSMTDTTPHLSHVRDIGWRKASGDIVASIDDDVVVGRHWVRTIKRAFREVKGLGGLTGPTVIPTELLKKRDVFFFHTTEHWFWKRVACLYFFLFMNSERFAIGKIYPSGAWSPGSNFPDSLLFRKPVSVDYLEACNYAIRKNVLSEVGGYDLGYTGTSEWCEVDMAFRVRKNGYPLLFDPGVSVEHHVSTGGVYGRRSFPFHRIRNFVRFYTTTYYPKTVTGLVQCILYIMFISVYYGVCSVRGSMSRLSVAF